MAENEILDFVRTQLTLPDKYDPADAMNWQHTLYSRLGGGRTPREDEEDKKLVPTVDDTVERIVAMAKVLYGLHIVSLLIFRSWPSQYHTLKLLSFQHVIHYCSFILFDLI